MALHGRALARLAADDEPWGEVLEREVDLFAVPYHLWSQRGRGEMVVWLPEDPALAEVPGREGFYRDGQRVTGSHCWAADTYAALIDGVLPESSIDHDLPRHTFWPRRGSEEWLAYDFREPRRVTRAGVYWFDDTGRGRCRVPASWRLAWRDGEVWRPVELRAGSAYGTERDRFNEVEFEPVEARALRLEVRLAPEVSAGVLEWRVE